MSRTVPARGALVAWACLTVAIVAEVVGTSFMAHAARDGGWTGYLVMAGALALSYFFLAQSVRRIAVGVAYAVWEGLGLTLLTVVGLTVFGEACRCSSWPAWCWRWSASSASLSGRHTDEHPGSVFRDLFGADRRRRQHDGGQVGGLPPLALGRWSDRHGLDCLALLGQAVRYMDLATAYAMWGAIGVIGTATCGRLLFGNRLRPIGWVGIALVTVAVLLLSTAK